MRESRFLFTDSIVSPVPASARRHFQKIVCLVFGHSVSNRTFANQRGAFRQCPCGDIILKDDGSETHVSHTLSCFFFGHNYTRSEVRDGHSEYICEDCGHPLLFDRDTSAYARRQAFHKQVQYSCIPRGHRLHTVAERHGWVEYACDCGHSFLLPEKGRKKFRHPARCFFAGHRIGFVERRGEFEEFRCRDCGHPFCFVAGNRCSA